MRPYGLIAALALSLTPTAGRADELRAFFGFHRCYFEIPARPVLRTQTRLVVVEPGYWEHPLMAGAYAPIAGSGTFYHNRAATTQRQPRAERTTAVWHEPVYMKVREPVVIDPGHTILLHAENCWPNR